MRIIIDRVHNYYHNGEDYSLNNAAGAAGIWVKEFLHKRKN